MFYQVHLILIRIYQSGERKVTRWHFAGVYDFFANSIHTACNIITEMHTTYQCQSELQIALTCWLDASFPFVKRSPYEIQLNRMQCVASLMSIIQLNKSHLVNWRTPTCDDHNFVCATPIGSSSYIVIDSQCILSQSYRFTMSRDDHEIKLFDRPWNWCPAFIEWSELYLQSVNSPPLTSLMPLIATTKTLLNGNTTIDYAWISLIIEWYDSFAVCARVWKMGPFCSIVQHTIITMMMRSIIVIRKMTISVCRLTRVIIAIALCPHTDHNTRRCSKEIHCWYHIVYCKQLSPKHRLSMCVCSACRLILRAWCMVRARVLSTTLRMPPQSGFLWKFFRHSKPSHQRQFDTLFSSSADWSTDTEIQEFSCARAYTVLLTRCIYISTIRACRGKNKLLNIIWIWS